MSLASVAACSQFHTTFLSGDALQGRNNSTAESGKAQNYLIHLMKSRGASGLNTSVQGDAAFKQVFATGTNILGLIPGTDLAHEYIMIGAHYDHLGNCDVASPGDLICNGATDNATGVAATLDLGLFFSVPENRPRRSVILAFWDAEEDGLAGSLHYVNNPLVPLGDTVAYINFDILGSNLLPSLRDFSFAVGAESGGTALVAAVDAAAANELLDVKQFSEIFGQGRSDHANLIAAGVPSVFFTDATGPCYHTTGDDISIVDFGKLYQQTRIAFSLASDLASGGITPVYDPAAAVATYEDAVVLSSLINQALPDIDRFTASQQANLMNWASTMSTMVADGAVFFDGNDVNTMLVIALQTVSLLASGDCDGFLVAQ
jgi:hypothetical protein